MIAAIVNAVAVAIGSCIGLFVKKGIPEKYTSAIMQAIGLCVMLIGIEGAIGSGNVLIMIVSMVLGTLVGMLLDLDGKVNALGKLADKLVPQKEGQPSAAAGFVAASLLMCVGAMTIVGSIEAGLRGDGSLLYTKSIMDFISSIFLTLSLGIGVLLSSVTILVVQGGIVLLAVALAPFFTDPIISAMSTVGSVTILALGLNLIGVTKFKVANFLPAIIIAPILTILWSLVGLG
ncbi:MAG: DUF554 domain-containing protein [Lachnospiraceae bacterium]|nr:DUF554 domain-containing protein [Lachnospiraceae bacterium]